MPSKDYFFSNGTEDEEGLDLALEKAAKEPGTPREASFAAHYLTAEERDDALQRSVDAKQEAKPRGPKAS